MPSRRDDHQYLGRVDHTLHRQPPVSTGALWVSRASMPAVSIDGNIFTQRVRPHLAEHGLLGQRHLHRQPEPAEQPGGDVQPHQQRQLPDLSARLLVARHQRLQRRDAAVVLQRQRLFRHQQRRHEHVPAQRVPGRRHASAGRRARHELATGVDYSYGQGDIVNNFRANGRFTFSGAAPFTGDALADFMLGKFSSFEQGDRRVQEHPDALRSRRSSRTRSA